MFQNKTFPVTFNSRAAGLTLDWTLGFTLAYEGMSEPVWRYKFHQLRGSSDDGKGKLKLHFQEQDTIAIETKVRDFWTSEVGFVLSIDIFSSEDRCKSFVRLSLNISM